MTNEQYLSGGGANSVAPNLPPQYIQHPLRMAHVSGSTVYTAYRGKLAFIIVWHLTLDKIIYKFEVLLKNCSK